MTATPGLVTIGSRAGLSETLGRLRAAIAAHGLTLFAEIDHAAGARTVGLTLRPTTLLILGNARGGTPLMQADQRAGIDLPLKVLVWEDEGGTVQISYNEPSWFAERHGLAHPVLAAMSDLLAALAREAADGTAAAARPS